MRAAAAFCAELPGDGLQVHVLGCGSGYPTAARDTSSLLIGAPDGWTLVDCPGSVVHKLARLGVVAAHGLEGEGYPRVEGIEIALEEGTEIAAGAATTIRFTPAVHGRDTVAVRFDTVTSSVCHSSDTTPNAALVRLARGADMLFHDCAGPHRLKGGFSTSHSSAREAAEVAADAGVGALVLMHLGAVDDTVLEECVREAESGFSGEVILAHDGATWALGATAR